LRNGRSITARSKPRSPQPLCSNSRVVVVFFGLLARHPVANLLNYAFMIEGLGETAQKLVHRKIGFVSESPPARSQSRSLRKWDG
jgi:hypothetical protein